MPHLSPLDQAHGLRTLFAHAQVRFVPVVSNPHVAFGGMMLERLCTAFAGHGAKVLVVDASERASGPSEMALLDLAACVEPLSPQVSYLAARGLPLRYVDTTGSTRPFLDAAAESAPGSQVVIVHAAASELCRLFARRSGDSDENVACPLLLAADHPVSVTHAYAAMKLLARRAGLLVHDLALGIADDSPRAERIAMQIAICADDFLGAVLRDWIRVDPATDASEAPTAALHRWAGRRLRPAEACAPALSRVTAPAVEPPPPLRAGAERHSASTWAFN